jgi:hypothetical protein
LRQLNANPLARHNIEEMSLALDSRSQKRHRQLQSVASRAATRGDQHRYRQSEVMLRTSVAEITERARKTWQAEPLFHISSPLAGWDGPKPERHHDYIDPGDFPLEWLGWPLTVEVEAKAKELAVTRLIADLNGEGGSYAR